METVGHKPTEVVLYSVKFRAGKNPFDSAKEFSMIIVPRGGLSVLLSLLEDHIKHVSHIFPMPGAAFLEAVRANS